MTSMAQSSRIKLIFIGLFLATLIILMPPYADNFIGDDYFQLDRVTELAARPSAAWQVLNPFWQPWYYRPWQNGWILANRLIFGFNPFGFYWLQILMHLLVIALLYRVGRRLGLSRWAGLTAAALFGLHGHWFDTVTWIASIAIVSAAAFSLLAVWCFLEFLDGPKRAQGTQRKKTKPSVANFQWLTILFVTLTLITHEEGFLLPIYLVVVWVSRQKEWRQIRLKRVLGERDGRLLLILLALDLIYLIIQLTRPNELISAAAAPDGGWLAAVFNLRQIGLYGAQWVVRGLALLNQPPPLVNPVVVTLFAGVSGGLLILWFIWGSRRVRLGLFWLGLHIAFIYLALWVQKPQFFAGRHMYQGMLGLALAAGTGLDQFSTRYRRRRDRQRFWQISLGLAAIVLIHFAFTLQNMQRNWADTLVAEDKSVAAQMRQLMPTVTADTRVFASRFSTAASYLPAHVMVWYNQPLAEPGGSLTKLQAYGRATRDFFVFDYDDENGRLTNFMPDLQDHDETIFLWAQTPVVTLIEADDAVPPDPPTMRILTSREQSRLAFAAEPPDTGWLSWSYQLEIPANGRLKFAIHGQDTQFRVRLITPDQTRLLQETSRPNNEWQEAEIDLSDFASQTVEILLETAVNPGYWTNPRLVVD